MNSRPSEALAAHRPAVLDVLRRHHLEAPRVFGAAARGEDRVGSALDLMVDPIGAVDVLDFIEAADDLEELLGCPVELVSSRALRPDHEIRHAAVAV